MKYLNKENTQDYWGLDVETDGLDSTVIWCCCVRNLTTEEELTFFNKEVFNAWLASDVDNTRCFIGHNILSFDMPVLNRLWACGISLSRCIDTLVLSYLYNPAIEDGHSLEAWGHRLKYPKGDYSDWSRLTEEMVEYCLTPDHKVLRSDLRWVELGDIKEGETILGFDENGPNRKFKKAVVEKAQKKKAEVFEVRLSSGKTFRTTADHKWLTTVEHNGRKIFGNWVPTKNLRHSGKSVSKVIRFLEPWEEDLSKEAGWLAGIFDGEATLSKDRFECSVAQNPGVVLSKIEQLLKEKYTGEVSVYNHHECRKVALRTNKYHLLRFLGSVRPERLLEKVDFNSLGRIENRNSLVDEVISVESMGEQEIIVLSTSTNTFVADGYLMHNCRQDVRLTLRVYEALKNKMLNLGYSELSCKIEHDIRVVIDEQEINGMYFNHVAAKSFQSELFRRQSDLSEGISKLFPPVRKKVAEYSFRRRKDGSPVASYEAHRVKYSDVVHTKNSDGEDIYECYELIPFNPNSPKQRVERLLELGWEPDKFTKKGFPQVDEESLVRYAEVSGRKEIAALAEYLVIQGRASMLETWLNYVQVDSRIHGEIFTCGATTRRMRHVKPNTSNIPSGAKARYGHECRSFWGVQPGSGLVLVGYDAAGLETAGLCHYLDNDTATEILLRPKPDDIHTANSRRLSEALGWPIDREWGAKTSWYAWLYGAYPTKLGSIVGGSKHGMKEDKAGEVVVDTFFRNVPGLKRLINDTQNEWKTSSGRLRTIDSGSVICPSVGAALNYRVQGLGAILMKYTSIILREEARKLKIPYKKVGDIHDEGQLETPKEYGDQLGKLAVWSIEEAGRRLKLNIPVSGDYKIGLSWAETH